MLEQEEIKTPSKRSAMPRIAAAAVSVLISLFCGSAAALAVYGTAKTAADGSLSHYFADTPAFFALIILIPISVLLPVIFSFLIKGEVPSGSSIVTAALSWLAAMGCLAVSMYTLLKGLGVSWDIGFSLIALISSVFYVFKPIPEFKTAKIFLSFAPTALGIAMIALLYFDFSIELNSHYKLATQFAAVGLMLGTIADARHVMSRIKLGRLILLRSLSLTLTLICSGSVITAFICGITSLPAYYLTFALFFLLYSLITASELVSLALGKPQA